MSESEKSEKIESRNIPTDNKKSKPTKSRKPRNKGGETKRIEILLGKIFHRPHKKLPRSIKPPSQSPFFPNLAFLTNIQTNQYNQKVSKNFSEFKNVTVDTAAANANSTGESVITNV